MFRLGAFAKRLVKNRHPRASATAWRFDERIVNHVTLQMMEELPAAWTLMCRMRIGLGGTGTDRAEEGGGYKGIRDVDNVSTHQVTVRYVLCAVVVQRKMRGCG